MPEQVERRERTPKKLVGDEPSRLRAARVDSGGMQGPAMRSAQAADPLSAARVDSDAQRSLPKRSAQAADPLSAARVDWGRTGASAELRLTARSGCGGLLGAGALIVALATSCGGGGGTGTGTEGGGAAGDAFAAGSSSRGLLFDGAHNGGTSGFYFLPPLVTFPLLSGDFAPNASPTVEIWELDLSGEPAFLLATFDETSGTNGHVVHFTQPPWSQGFAVDWHTNEFALSPAITYRIRVFVPGERELGFADVDLVADKNEFRTVDRNLYVPMVNGHILPINFRIERQAIDADDDRIIDWLDNCPIIFNHDQADADANGVGDACECGSCDDDNPCTFDYCDNIEGCLHEAEEDFVYEEDGDCTLECVNGELVETCEPTCGGLETITEVEPNADPGEATNIPAPAAGVLEIISGYLEDNTDVDLYRLDVPAGDGGAVSAFLSAAPNDRWSCYAGQILEVLDDSGAPIVQGVGVCPKLPPFEVTAGATHYLRVRSEPNAGWTPYYLHVELTPAPRPESEPNDDWSQANLTGLAGYGRVIYSGSVSPVDQSDVFSFTVLPGQETYLDVRSHGAPEAGFQCDIFALYFYVDGPGFSGGAGFDETWCPRFDDAGPLEPGDYFITYFRFAPPHWNETGYILDITLRGPPEGCGDGIIQECEQCDGGPCCDDSCNFVEIDSECYSDCGVGLCTGDSASCTTQTALPEGIVCRENQGICDEAETCDGVSFDCPPDDDLTGQETTCGYGACAATGEWLCNDGMYEDSCSPGDPSSWYDDTCDGIDEDCDGEVDEDFETGEIGDCTRTCIDGVAQFTCEGQCGEVITVEQEPNDGSSSSATPSISAEGSVTLVGAVSGSSDEDWFAIQIPPGPGLALTAKINPPGETWCLEAVTLELFDDAGDLIAWPGNEWCPEILTFGALPAGNYHLRAASRWNDGSSDVPYYLELTLLSARAETEPNEELSPEQTGLFGEAKVAYVGSVDETDTADWYTFEVPEGRSLSVRARIHGTPDNDFRCDWGSLDVDIEGDDYFQWGDTGDDGCPIARSWGSLDPGIYIVRVYGGNSGGGEGGEGEGGGGPVPYALDIELVEPEMVCGDGMVTGCEECDGDPCCDESCRFAEAGTMCANYGTCGGGTCSGASGECEVTAPLEAGSICRWQAGGCDIEEACDGTSYDCPEDLFVSAGTVCSPISGPCDLEEVCAGDSPWCPWDQFEPPTTLCRASAGDCDLDDYCTGWSGDCHDAFAADQGPTECRGSAGDCDVAELCRPFEPTCPEDQVRPNSHVCRLSTALCDATEYCTGETVDCPEEQGPEGVVCRTPSQGSCDVAEVCTAEGICPPDALAGPGECEPEPHWVVSFPNSRANTVFIDGDDNHYVQGFMDYGFDPWITVDITTKHFVAKYSGTGQLLWRWENPVEWIDYGGGSNIFSGIRLQPLVVDSAGDVLIIRKYGLGAHFIQFSKMVVSKLSGSTGALLWSASFTDPIDEAVFPSTCPGCSYTDPIIPRSIGVDAAGFVYVAGAVHRTVPMMVGGLTLASNWLAKLTPDGFLMWVQRLDDRPAKIAVTPGGDVYLSHPASWRGIDIVRRSGVDGSFLWRVNVLGEEGVNFFGYGVSGMAIDPSGDVFVGGTWYPDTDPFGNYADIFLLRISPAGEIVWQRSFHGPGGNEDLAGIAVDEDGELAIGGTLRSSLIDFGAGPLNSGATPDRPQMFAGQLSPVDGSYRWVRRIAVIGPTGWVIGGGVGLGSVAAVGTVVFGGAADVDGTIVPAGSGFLYNLEPRETTFGNGVLDPGEACDSGACCTLFSHFSPPGTVCGRGGAVCSGTSAECVITCGNGQLDPNEICDGTICCTDDCAPASPQVVCREPATHWDVADHCTGTSGDCPEDQLAPHGAICDDGDITTHSDIVTAGNTCAGTPKVCPPDTACVSYSAAIDGTPFCARTYAAAGTPCVDGLSCVAGGSKVCDGAGLCAYAH